MNKKIMGKILPMFLIAILIQTNFFGMNFGTYFDLPNERGGQPYNSFRHYIWGGQGEQTDGMYGWNLTYIENLNGDAYPDLVVGTPWYDNGAVADVGRVYIFYGKADTGFNDLNLSQADVKITGDALGNEFGWDVADAGDINNDGINDLIVGAPGVLNNRGKAYIFYGGSIPSGATTASLIANRILQGPTDDGYYGSSVSGVGDLNKDGYDDVVVGAPGADHVVITYGYKNKVTLYPDLWDDDKTTKGIVTFDKGCNNGIMDNNTWGLAGENDGWDWNDSFHDPTQLYGQGTGVTVDMCNLYAPWEADGPDADGLTWSNRSSLEITIGRNHTDYNPYGLDSNSDDSVAASAAWGIEINITPEQWDYISGNSSISMGFDYSLVDTTWMYNKGNNTQWCTYAIISRFWNDTGFYFLGDTLNGGNKYLYYFHEGWNSPSWPPVYSSFNSDITEYIDGPGSYYWDFGCYFDFYWRSRADDGMTAFFDNITMKISNEKSIIVKGTKNSGFGTSITAVGDINEDDYPDLLIGAPNLDGGYVGLLPGKKKFKAVDSISGARIILTGKNHGDRFGYSISSAGDVDNDGLKDIIIGAPGGNYAHLYYGKTLKQPLLVPDLWEMDEEKGTPQLEFDTGVKTTGNTPGLPATDDGWDTWNGVYGFESGETPGSSVTYNGINGISSQEIANDDELIIYIGGNLGGGGFSGAKPDSGAYGVKFSISQAMASALESGAEAVLSYDWSFKNYGLDQDDTIWIKTYIRGDDNSALGWSLDKDAVDNDNKDSSNETYWSDTPEDITNVFVQKCSECFSTQGSYYLDIGAKVRDWYWEAGVYEDGAFHFDNVYLRFNPPPDIEFIGPEYSDFGASVGYSEKLNVDEYNDIIIGAPYYDLSSGNDTGAIFGFLMGPNTDKIRLAETAEFINYGEQPGDNLGWTISGELSLDSDDFSEIITSAINYDSSMDNIGKIYLFSITKIPRIRLLYPTGSELLIGNVTVNATVTDPDNNIDNSIGVRFYYSTDLNKWTIIGDDKTPTSITNTYEHFWNTSNLPDGTNYYIKAWVRDIELNMAENISSAFTVDNPHPPEIRILNLENEKVVAAKVEIKVKVTDSELDNIGGGINTTQGIDLYFSKDSTTWELIGTEKKGTDDVYSFFLDTRKYPDREYWLKANATDFDGFHVEDQTNIFIDNPSRPPSIKLLEPLGVEEVSGITTVRATAFDLDGDINSSGISFYIATDDSKDNWMFIGNSSEPVMNQTGAEIYTFEWDTRKVADDWYRLKAFVQDEDNLTNESGISEFKVHNNKENPPEIVIVTPKGGEMLKETQMIRVRVRDLEDNIDEHGVEFYYSEDKVKWRYIGVTKDPELTGSEYYGYLWRTDTVPDGEYWLNATVADTTGLRNWYIPDEPIFLHNSNMNPPLVRVLTPTRGEHINGTFTLKAYALDLENNIDTNGVLFMYSMDGKDWSMLSYSPTPTVQKGTIYEYSWDTTQHPDGRYWLRAEASDFDGLKGSGKSDYFFIHNNQNNAPTVKLIHPRSGEFSGQVKINATAFDLENNINEKGMNFYFSTDNSTWILINSDPSGTPIEEDRLFYELTWDSTNILDDYYWVKAEAEDLTNMIGNDISDKLIIHNKQTNPPKITLVQPRKGIPLDPIQSIIVDVIDFDNDVESVAFLYSTDNKTWELIDSRLKPEIGSTYRTIWNTENVYNGDYYIKIVAKDKMGNDEELTAGPFQVTAGMKRADSGTSDFLSSNSLWILIIITIIVIMTLLIVLLMRRSKKREKELIEEVSAEMRGDQAMEGEIETVPGKGKNETAADSYQTYIPPSGVQERPAPQFVAGEPDVETIESYKAQMDAWNAEGYDVIRLEQLYSSDEKMFAQAFPIYASNISKLKNISSKLDSMNTAGYENEVDSIMSKLFSSDQVMAAENELRNLEVKLGLVPAEMGAVRGSSPALGTASDLPGTTPELPSIDELLPQLLPADTSKPLSQETEQPSETEIPPDIELPPEIDLPPDTEQPSEPETSDLQEPENTSGDANKTNSEEKKDL